MLLVARGVVGQRRHMSLRTPACRGDEVLTPHQVRTACPIIVQRVGEKASGMRPLRPPLATAGQWA